MYQFSKSLKREFGIPKATNVNKWTLARRIDKCDGWRKFASHSAATLVLGRKANWCDNFPGRPPDVRYFIRRPPPGEKAKFKFISFLITTSLAVIGTFLYNMYKVKIRYSRLIPENADMLPLSECNDYIYICDPFVEAGIWQTQLLPWLPHLKDPSYTVAWRLVKDTSSSDVEKRRNAVAMLSKMMLEDSLYRQIAQMVEFETGVGLAHSNADPRLVDRNRSINLKCPHINLGERFREILNSLPKDRIHQCVVDYSDAAIRSFMPSEQELESITLETLTGFESEQIVGAKYKRKLREDQFLLPCLQAILSHSRVRENTALLLQLKLVDVLMTVVEKYRGNREIMYLVVKIIANLTCDPNIAIYVRDTGVLRLLAELAESVDLKFSMPARRALHNLDREYITPILPPGIYQLYPDFRFDENQLDIDIVFVHGLLGGAFRTWRRQDKKAVLRVTMKPGDNPKPSKVKAWLEGFTPLSKGDPNYKEGKAASEVVKDRKSASRIWRNGKWIVTDECHSVEYESRPAGASQCWPRDWLPKDIENARILAVDFDSFVTHWTKVCPVENIGRTLFDRSSELLEKLTSAGIGNRPIIWVTHSMGGLLVKHLLSQASSSNSEDNKAVAAQTRAIMFCSVPHIGSSVASRSSAGPALLLMPTQEVKELTYGSEELKALNAHFKRLREDMHYKVISFGETKDVVVSSLGMKLQLVPLSSADPGYGDFYTLDIDHLNICKVPSRGAFVYRKLVELVENVRNRCSAFDDAEETPAPVLFPPGEPKAKKKKVVEPDKPELPNDNNKINK